MQQLRLIRRAVRPANAYTPDSSPIFSSTDEKRSKKTKKHEATTPDEAASDPIASQANSSEVEDTNNERDPQASSSQSASRNDQANSDSESDGDPSRLVHESVLNSGKSKHGPRTKFVPESETAEQRNERTVFVGNVPVDLVKDRVREMTHLIPVLMLTLGHHSRYKKN